MNYEIDGRCACASCSGSGCRCGCQAGVAACYPNFAGHACDCAGGCGCDSGEQGCLC